jgi:hypothetical protein
MWSYVSYEDYPLKIYAAQKIFQIHLAVGIKGSKIGMIPKGDFGR